MPEGDSIHRASERLRPLVGCRLSAESPNPRGLLTGVAAAIDGRILENVTAVGKHLLLHFEGGVTVRSHLRMSGRWRVAPAGCSRVGSPWLVLRGGGYEATQWNSPILTLDSTPVRRLGPEVLDPDFAAPDAAKRVVNQGRRPLGEVILDQQVVAGIGNMWMAEALWHGRLSPWLPAAEAPVDLLTECLGWVARAMRASVTGTRPRRVVYRRSGRPCSRCGAVIASRGLGDDNRTAYWCPGCQIGPDGITAG